MMSVVLVTGCSSGIGLETALAFARRGDTTIATMRNLAKAELLQQRAAEAGLRVHLQQLDVNDDESVAAAIAAIVDSHGGVDVLVNNAGVGNRGPVETMSIDNAMLLMDTNFWGPVRTIRAALPTMREQRSGVIINVSSMASRVPATLYTSMYAASKTALNAVSEALAGEVAPFGIRLYPSSQGSSRQRSRPTT
jgi:NAD(P)-dependent dehydrogenase (short-subunit alcohol dehydrogenase family)